MADAQQLLNRLPCHLPSHLRGNEVAVLEPRPCHAPDHGVHLDRRVLVPVVASRELVDVPVQMLGTDPMVATLQHGPRGLDPIGARHPVHTLAYGMRDGLVVGKTMIAAIVIGVDLRGGGYLPDDETLESGLVRALAGARVIQSLQPCQVSRTGSWPIAA